MDVAARHRDRVEEAARNISVNLRPGHVASHVGGKGRGVQDGTEGKRALRFEFTQYLVEAEKVRGHEKSGLHQESG